MTILTDKKLRELFCATNTAEPLAEGWPGLERFARAIEAAIHPDLDSVVGAWQRLAVEWRERAERAEEALNRPDPLGEALNSGEGTYRP